MTRATRANVRATMADVATALVSALAGTLTTSVPNDPVYSIVDSSGRMALAVKIDGSVRIYKLDLASIVDGTLSGAKLDTATQSQLVSVGVGSMLSTAPETSGYVWSVVDSAGRIGLALKPDGTVFGKIPLLDGSVTAAKLDSGLAARIPPQPWALAPVPEVTSDKVFLNSLTTGTRTLLGTVTGATNPTLLDSASVRVDTSGGPKWVSTTRSTPGPVFPTNSIAMWGDSLTYTLTGSGVQGSPTVPQTIATDLGIACYNGGLGSHGSAEIATRQGGLQPLITLTGNQIPSGSTAAITVTAISPSDGWQISTTQGGNLDMHGTLAGVAGKLRHTLTGSLNFTFIPDSAPGSNVSVPAATPFIGDEGVSMRDRINIIWAGTNNKDQPAAIVRDIASMIANLTPYAKRVLVVNNTVDKGYATAINAALLAAFPGQYVDLRGYLIASGLAAAGVTPTTQDNTDIAAGNIPSSLQWDGLHFTQTAYNVIGHYLASVVTSKGWTA